ncbi:MULTISPECIES: ABC transporter permease [Nesterenkonia]|uniref:ABC-2 type transport system permease protein n=1 Tax=Nesterenkonia xinjiangensis TaxID=225327 RepID=A0A7Z0KB74_9MICC|nr:MULTISPECIES: ABC transporter permease [Nesterenkonia]MDZ5078346.1 ABC transporter permease [Nesterenkonia sp. HG001]NYJ79668.1 ABC-2 type transport system permease protein [Nesterenkonia xinjiangensis]
MSLQTASPAPAARRILAHGAYETRNVLRNGEQLLVSVILPLLVLVGAHRLDLVAGSAADGLTVPSIDVITPGVLALAVMASAFTGQGIAAGFERQYGVLAYLSTTPLGPTGLILGKAVAVACVVAIQVVVIGTAGLVLGWQPSPGGLAWLLIFLLLGATAFTALGLLLAGTVRAEATLAVTNILWVLLGAAGGAVFPLHHEGPGVLLLLLPSAALGEGLRAATIDGALAPVPALVLASWSVLAVLAARRWFQWR